MTPWTVCSLPGSSVHGISQQKYWSGLPFPPPGDLIDPGMDPASPAWQVDSLPPSHLGSSNASYLSDASSGPFTFIQNNFVEDFPRAVIDLGTEDTLGTPRARHPGM